MHEKLKRAAYCLTVTPSLQSYTPAKALPSDHQDKDWTEEDFFERKDLPSSLRTPEQGSATAPLFCADRTTLGERKTAQITEMNLCAFEKVCDELLAKISGPVMREYYGSLAQGEMRSFEAHTRLPREKSFSDLKGIDANKLDQFNHFLASLSSVKHEGSLNRPNLLSAVARLLGDSLEPPSSFTILERAAIERARAVGKALERSGATTKCQTKGSHAAAVAELRALEGVISSIYRALTDDTTMRMLAPVPTVKQRLRSASTSMGSLVYAGVASLAEKTALYLQGAETHAEHSGTQSP